MKIEKKVLVVGLGESGLAAAKWLVRQGSQVTVSEVRKKADFNKDVVADLLRSGVKLEFGGHRIKSFLESDLIVVSPGISLDIRPLSQARDQGVPIIGEIELASRYLKTPCIAVTGTNGKSTVVNLIGEMLRKGGKRVFIGGNIGCPLTYYIAGEQNADYVILEVSSFQLDTTQTFSPLMSLILNISPDHLDRYADYTSYARSKERIFANQGPGQALILNDDDPWLRKEQPQNGPTVYRYGLESKPERIAALKNGNIEAKLPGEEMIKFYLERFSLPGNHNRANLMAAIITCLILKVPPSAIQEAIDHFKGLLHRIERVDTVRGITFYDDSKATNIDAAIKSIASFSKPVVLIAGGRDKGSDYHPLVEAASERVKGAVFLGEASGLLSAAFGNKISWSMANNMNHAVSLAFNKARKGDVVLLAPACASFDMFKDFAHRGEVFKDAVRRLKNGVKEDS
ncbi:MAG: UDP-N-acetylmuramoyl-L-alanine--D-glutamate ligase [Deltaproteobacteria bacterium]|nr:UDP-N-acetylmuramoyl-L-alanine--D-glutamate ligase [Deltaproteobacteria bacterium]OQY16374.1 MAG: UDP-N-acetylmuramoyl-L-alanine--D-glutamate ligase [Desulfobacterium sp. 4572_20]RLB25836.1 MAG: UDP-N-acetylmuramoyl-L-alanine--D-glutamate ligase [Deltaproteobacteria bacterium]HDH87140.1 UDP-N-acetylmuramoyl-L-alanine--D-glutamate ligase [Desulfobacteraceae bacterium]